MKNGIFILIFLLGFFPSLFSQQSSYFDAAQSYNRLLIEKNTGTYQRISNYKVIGTSYLFGELNTGDIHSKNESAAKILVKYNTYTQEVEFSYSTNFATFLKEPGTLDSFLINKNESAGFSKDLYFINANLLGSTTHNYYQVVTKGEKVNLYKKYFSELGIVSTDYVQAD